jgi:hypothetical protein
MISRYPNTAATVLLATVIALATISVILMETLI